MITWRELKEEIDKWPAEVQDVYAEVWTPSDGNYDLLDEFTCLAGVSGYNADLPISADNPPSVTLGI